MLGWGYKWQPVECARRKGNLHAWLKERGREEKKRRENKAAEISEFLFVRVR